LNVRLFIVMIIMYLNIHEKYAVGKMTFPCPK
jgi:hypothetical protein